LWIVSIVCLFKAVNGATTVEESVERYGASAADQLFIQHQAHIADCWAAVGWALQFASAAVLSLGQRSPRVVRRIFVSLGVLVAADGITLLLMAVIIR
jgi:hypothetical protein